MADKEKRATNQALEVGGKGLAFHGPMLYEVKVLKVYDPRTGKTLIKQSAADGGQIEEIDDKEAPETASETQYFVHYRGWKVTWDEWVGNDRILPYNDENLAIEKELRKAHTSKKTKRTNATTPGRGGRRSLAGRDSTPVREGAPRGVKRRAHHEETLGSEEEYINTAEIHLSIPPSLKSLLVDDWEYVTKDHKVVPLPRSPTVSDILLKYTEAHKPAGDTVSAARETFDEIVSGIKLYFDKSLGNLLLYRYERPQYFKVRHRDKDFVASDVYGAEHLLRLFVALPGLIAQTSMDAQAVRTLRRNLEDFLRFLASHEKEFFTSNYEDSGRSVETNDG